MPTFMGKRREDVEGVEGVEKIEDVGGVEKIEDVGGVEETKENENSEPEYVAEFRNALIAMREAIEEIRESMAVLATEGIYINDVPVVKEQVKEVEDEINELDDLDFNI